MSRIRSMVATTLAGLVVAAAAPGLVGAKADPVRADRDSSPAEWSLVETVLQLNLHPAEVQGIHMLLQSQSYVGSVNPGTVLSSASSKGAFLNFLRGGGTAAEWVQGGQTAPSSDITFLDSQSLAGNMFTLSAAATSEQRALGAVHAVMDNLRQHLGRTKERAEAAALRARTEVRELEQELARVREGRAQAVERFGGVDPSDWLTLLRGRLLESRSKLMDRESDLAVRRSVRDFRALRLADTPATVMRPGDNVRNPRFVELEREIASLEAESNSLVLAMQRLGSAPAMQEQRDEIGEKVAVLQERLALTEATLGNVDKYLPGPEVEVQNPGHQRQEADILLMEQQIAESSAEMEALENTIRRMESEVGRYEDLVFMTDRLDEQMQELYRRLASARKVADRAQEELRSTEGQPLSIISGPTPVTRSSR